MFLRIYSMIIYYFYFLLLYLILSGHCGILKVLKQNFHPGQFFSIMETYCYLFLYFMLEYKEISIFLQELLMFVKRDFLQMNMCHLRYHTEIHYIAFVFYLIGELTFYLVIINEIYNLINLYFEYLLYIALTQIMFQSPRLSNFSLIFLIFYQFLQYLVCKFKKHLFHFIYLFLYIFYT